MTQLREEVYFTKGRVIVRGKTVRRGEARKVDYILFYKPGIPIAIVEAKDNNHSVGAGMQQAIAYAEVLDVPFAYTSNGDAFLEHDRTGTGGPVEREIALSEANRERVAANGRPLGRGGVSRDKRLSPSTRVGWSRTGPAALTSRQVLTGLVDGLQTASPLRRSRPSNSTISEDGQL